LGSAGGYHPYGTHCGTSIQTREALKAMNDFTGPGWALHCGDALTVLRVM